LLQNEKDVIYTLMKQFGCKRDTDFIRISFIYLLMS